mgnify:CR=1 FL=1
MDTDSHFGTEDQDQVARNKKQLFLIENVAEDGFDTSKFNQFLAQSKQIVSFDIEAYTFEQLYDLVQDFKAQKA